MFTTGMGRVQISESTVHFSPAHTFSCIWEVWIENTIQGSLAVFFWDWLCISVQTHHVPISSSVYSTLGIDSPLEKDRYQSNICAKMSREANIAYGKHFCNILFIFEGNVSNHLPSFSVNRVSESLRRHQKTYIRNTWQNLGNQIYILIY